MQTIHLPDFRLHYDIAGKGVPLLLIHGLGSSGRDWEKQVPFFEKDYQVIALDLRGHGQSDKPPGPYSIRMFAEDTAALLCELEVESAHIAGISMGGMVALELALQFPELVRRLTIINSYPEMRVETFSEHLQIWRRFLLLELLGMRGIGVILAKRLFPKPEQGELRSLFVERWAANDKRAYRNSLRAIVNWDVEAFLGNITCPVFVVASDQDYMPLDEKRAYTTKMPNARLVVIEDARHAVTVERPDEFNKLLMEFLNTL